MSEIDETHDPQLTSWAPGAAAPGCAFPIQNLPFGIYRPRRTRARARVGVAIGDMILDVEGAADLLEPAARTAARACAGSSLNGLMARGRDASSALRKGLSRLLGDRRREADASVLLTPMADAEMTLPAHIGDYTDFYASVFHATNVGRLFRPDNPLLPNYKWVPIGYHGRASSIRVSGAEVRRPKGQIASGGAAPRFLPSRSLDYELELGAFVGRGTDLGSPLTVDEASERWFGVCLLNDWSARDIQAWEYQPLGPFLSKSFLTSLSPWVVTAEALAPFRARAYARPHGDPEPLPHLSSAKDRADGGLAIGLRALITTAQMREQGLEPFVLSQADFADMYWTLAQMLAHHTSNGCDLRPGDLVGSGTVSGPDRRTAGCLLEINARGAEPVELPTGERRSFLEDGDEIVLEGACRREGFVPIGLGECRGLVAPAAS